MKRFRVVLLFAVSGCATDAQVMHTEATEFHSKESVADVAYCLSKKNSSPSKEMPDGVRRISVKNIYGALALEFDVFPEGAGSRVEYRRGKNIIGGVWKQCLGPGAAG